MWLRVMRVMLVCLFLCGVTGSEWTQRSPTAARWRSRAWAQSALSSTGATTTTTRSWANRPHPGGCWTCAWSWESWRRKTRAGEEEGWGWGLACPLPHAGILSAAIELPLPVWLILCCFVLACRRAPRRSALFMRTALSLRSSCCHLQVRKGMCCFCCSPFCVCELDRW